MTETLPERPEPSVDVEKTPDIEHLADVEDPRAMAAALESVSPADAAQLLRGLSAERVGEVAEALDPTRCAEMLVHMDADVAAQVVDVMPAENASRVLGEMSPDDRVDILDNVDEAKHDVLVAGLNAEDREEVRTLEQYEPDTAGGIMTTEVTALFEYLSVQDAIEQLRKLHEEFEQLWYVYVIDRRGHLVGVLSMRDLILAKPEVALRDIMIPDVRAVPAEMDQEEVAQIFRKYGYLAMPVVDERHRLIGLITVDDVVDVLEEEQTEDVHKLFGAGAEERLSSPWFFSFQKRVWWLMVNLGTAFLAGSVVAVFSGQIERLPILAAFLPIVAGMGGNASAQAMAVTVRGLSLGEVDRKLLWHVLIREFYVGGLTGLIVGLSTGVIAFFYANNAAADYTATAAFGLALIVFLALVINHAIACVSGAGIPFIMRRLGFDPAQSATIFATTVTDIVGFFALLGLAAVTAQAFGLA